jgi:CarboxypepD_reg-like domain
MKNIQLIIFTCFFSINLLSQSTKDLKGKIIDSKTKEAIPYASVGLIGANEGISSDEKGAFSFTNVHVKDTLIVSCVGYINVKIAVSDFKSVVELTPIIIELKTLTINPKKSKTIDINGFGKKNMGYDIGNNVIKLMQIAQFIENPDGKTWYLKEIKIGRRKKTYLGKNQKTQFKVRFYGVDSIGKPNSKDIFESLIVKNEADRVIKINIENKKLVLPRNGLFIAIEWIKIPENYIDETYRTSVIRNGVDVGKETHTDRFYTPMISARKPYEKEKNCRVYELDYKGIWMPKCFQVPFDNNGFSNNLNISVSVYD